MRVLDKTKKYTYHSNTSHGFCDLTILLGDKKDYYDDTFFHEGFLPKDFGDERFRTGEIEVIDSSKQAKYDLLRLYYGDGKSFCILRYSHYKKMMVSSPTYTRDFLRQLIIPRGREVEFTVKRPSIWGEEEDHWKFVGDNGFGQTRWECFLNGKSFMGGALLCKASWQGLLITHYEDVIVM
jgi:hypothetical protein